MHNIYEAPEIDRHNFTCPYCNTLSVMTWECLTSPHTPYTNKAMSISYGYQIAICHNCKQASVWRTETKESLALNALDFLDSRTEKHGDMIYPDISKGPRPSDDLPQDCMNDYNEASLISNKSPRGAAALLRLCIQKLCVHLGGKGKNLDDDIKMLVRNGLPDKIQQALDIVRIVGNNAVHPGVISLADKPETVSHLFALVNFIVKHQITQPRLISEEYAALPNGAKDAINERKKRV